MNENESAERVLTRMSDLNFNDAEVVIAERDRGVDFWGIAADMAEEARRARTEEAALREDRDRWLVAHNRAVAAFNSDHAALTEAEARVAELEEAIEDAPHGRECYQTGGTFYCNCWKRAALSPEGKEGR